MENAARADEQKFSAIIMHAPVGILEMNAPISLITEKDNFHDLLARLAPGILEKTNAFTDNNGLIFNEILGSSKITVSKLGADSFIVSFEDITEALEKELAFREATVDKAVAQGKFEIAADVLHDIGNAVVGFGSYLTRIKRAVEADTGENMQNLADFFSAKQPEISQAIGEAKAAAVVTMLHSMVQARHAYREDIQKSISEQLSIITHIQELLNIQRQYVVAGDTVEKKPANLRSIINDCLSMLYASMEKRGIHVALEILVESPIIQGHRTKLMQVIMNILKNSIEAIDVLAAEKSISVRLFQEGRQVILQVRDSGNGFDEDTGRRIFERGFTTKSSGTGLGLHNCRTILESHAATMTLLSDGPGKGSLSTIIFHI
jgi:signal transduction histidine kinase